MESSATRCVPKPFYQRRRAIADCQTSLQVYLSLLSAVQVVDYRVKEVVRAQQVVLSAGLVLVTFLANVRVEPLIVSAHTG